MRQRSSFSPIKMIHAQTLSEDVGLSVRALAALIRMAYPKTSKMQRAVSRLYKAQLAFAEVIAEEEGIIEDLLPSTIIPTGSKTDNNDPHRD